MAPPMENPLAYTRFKSMQAKDATSFTMALANPRSSTVFEQVQHGPKFHALSMPVGQAMRNPSASERAESPDMPFCLSGVSPIPWKSITKGTGLLPV